VAKFIPGPLVSEIRNALGNQVFSRNQYGAFTRARVDPDQTLTDARQFTQDAMQAANDAWQNALTDDDRNAWYALADAARVHARSPIFTQVNGPSLFMKLYLYAYWWSGNFLLEPPHDLDTPPLSSISLTANFDTPSLELDFAPTPVPPGQILMVYATPPLNPGVTRPLRWFKPIVGFPAATTSPQNIASQYLDAFPAPDPGQKIFVRCSLAYTYNNMPSAPLQAVASNTGIGDAMLHTQVTLTDTDIKALPTTPFELVPQPATGNILVLHRALMRTHFEDGAYTNIDADPANPVLYIGHANAGQLSNIVRNDVASSPYPGMLTSFLGAVNFWWDFSPAAFCDPTANWGLLPANNQGANDADQAIVIQAQNTAGDFTGGHANNTMIVDTFYSIIAL
jgi:hypothetical protein